MFIAETKSGYHSKIGDGQWASGLFLLLCNERPIISQDSRLGEIRALVRRVKMHQMGHFMMGTMRVGHYEFSVSGSYGGDGLPDRVPPAVYAQGIPLPQDLVDRWNKGGGHNGAGNEAGPMRQWAIQNLDRLQEDRKGLSFDETPDLNNPDTFNNRIVAVKDVNEAGVSWVGWKTDWIVEEFWAGGAAYKFTPTQSVCDSTTPKAKTHDNGSHNETIEAPLRSLWWDTIRESMNKSGWKHYGRDVHSLTYTPPTSWIPRLRYLAGFPEGK